MCKVVCIGGMIIVCVLCCVELSDAMPVTEETPDTGATLEPEGSS